MGLRVVCWIGLGCYVVLSATDLIYTSALLRGNCEAYEANPVAAACIEQHGLRGLAAYKTGGVIAFIGSVVLLLHHRPKVAAGLAIIGCCVMISVVMYSRGLIREARSAARHEAEWGIQWKETKPLPDDDSFDLHDLFDVSVR